MSRMVTRHCSVIDTATNPPSVVATVPVGETPEGSPSPRMGNTPMSRILPTRLGDRHGHRHGGGHDRGGANAGGVAVTPDGTHAYVAILTQHSFGDRHGHQHRGATIAVGSDPEGSPSPRMGNTPMSRMLR